MKNKNLNCAIHTSQGKMVMSKWHFMILTKDCCALGSGMGACHNSCSRGRKICWVQAWILVVAMKKKAWVRQEGYGSTILKSFFHIYSTIKEFTFV